ncbi:hypothetical protein FACS1894180_3060 [Bacteroidia bacterium]|nr:hypothetical protein FACS1894180_3060 [Bacteroidia bacterium]
MSHLLENKQFFEINNLLKQKKAFSPDVYFFYKMFSEQAFGNYKQAEKFAHKYEKYFRKKECSDSVRNYVSRTLSNFYAVNAMHRLDYAQVAKNYEMLLKNHATDYDSVRLADFANNVALFGTLKNTPPQKIVKPKQRIEIQSYRNQFNHLLVSVRKGVTHSKFVFDTGASFSLVTDSIAQQMGLKVLPVKINVHTAGSTSVQTNLAVADSFYVGNILFQNVVFLVVTQSSLTFDAVNYQIWGVIGMPVIMQMEEVHFLQDGKITVPRRPKKHRFQNLFVDGYNPVVQVFSENDTLLLHLDTGARTSELSYKYFKKNEQQIAQNAEIKTVMRGSAGGIQEKNEYALKNFAYRIGITQGTLPEISVVTENYEFNRLCDGNLGQDILLTYPETVLNFKYMYLKINELQ